MTKRTLGSVVKAAHDEARMTQRDLAKEVGIKASHVAYIENARRRPSISLINRLSETLGLDAKELLVLAHPEVKQIVDGDRPPAKKGDGAWPRFASNQSIAEASHDHQRGAQDSQTDCDARNRRPSGAFHLYPECHPAGVGQTLTGPNRPIGGFDIAT